MAPLFSTKVFKVRCITNPKPFRPKAVTLVIGDP